MSEASNSTEEALRAGWSVDRMSTQSRYEASSPVLHRNHLYPTQFGRYAPGVMLRKWLIESGEYVMTNQDLETVTVSTWVGAKTVYRARPQRASRAQL